MSSQHKIQNRDIVVVGLQPWDTTIGSNCKDIALEFSKHNRVLYVNYPLDRITLFRNKKEPNIQKRIRVIKGKEEGIVSLQQNLWNLYPDEMVESINWIKSSTIFTYLNKINNQRFARSINKAIKKLGFTNIILFDDNDFIRSFYLKELLRPAISIFYYRDFLLGVDYWKVHGKLLEPQILTKSDLCLTNSVYFADYCRHYNPHSYYVGQGCDLTMFTNIVDKHMPNDLAQCKGPLIGYVGALQSLRLSIEILEYVAKQRPDWQIILVGPEDSVFAVSKLHEIPNIHFLGAKRPDELPLYIHHFDVCLNPQLMNEVTIGNYPRKIDEYLAMGKPVVATSTEMMESVFSEHTYLGTTPSSYVALIERALNENSPEKQSARKLFAASHSWENNVGEIYKAINLVEPTLR
jgi:glycosyltransferase involved in cell wall biosynthesis